MTDNTESILFWLEQEPVESNEDVYLPPDTPITRPLPKIVYQMNKKQELKKLRAIERLKAYHFEQLAEYRKRFSSLVARDHLPKQHQEVLEFVDSATHLKEILPDILKLFDDIDKIKAGTSTVESLLIQEPPIADKNMQHQLNMNEQVREKYGENLEEQFHTQQKELRNQYAYTLNLIKPQPPRLVETAPVPPLPPRVSCKDPRERIAEEYPSNALPR